jgi:cytoskeletal protein CcmA (bactofilin family)
VTVATSEGTTIIGESIAVHGNVSGDEDLTVRGRLEGTLSLTRALVVDPTGVVKAEVQARSCVVAGAVAGNITATESVEIAKGGRVVGDISAPRVMLADGSSFRGRIDMGEVAIEGVALARPAARPALRPPPRPALRPAVEAEGGGEERTAARPPGPPVPVGMAGVKRKVIVRRK